MLIFRAMTRDEVLAAIDAAFREEPRPAHFVREPNHCEECADHEAVLQATSREVISLAEVGNPGWDPLCYVTDDAFRHLLPGLARLALGSGDDYYLDQFLFHLETGRINALNPAQAQAVAALLDYIRTSMADEIEAEMNAAEFDRVMVLLSEVTGPLPLMDGSAGFTHL